MRPPLQQIKQIAACNLEPSKKENRLKSVWRPGLEGYRPENSPIRFNFPKHAVVSRQDYIEMLEKGSANSGSKKYIGYSAIKAKQSLAGPCRSQNQSFSKEKKDEKGIKDYKRKFLAEKDSNNHPSFQNPSSSINSHRQSIQESILSKLKKNGILSNPITKQVSPRQSGDMDYQRHIRKRSDNKVGTFSQQLHLQSDEQPAVQTLQPITKNSFLYRYVIGKGGFGKVWRVQLKKNKREYAMKEMSKALIITKKSVPSVLNEKKLLATLKNPFIVNMVTSFQDRQTLYLVMDLMPGGDLRYHIGSRRRFSEEQTKFFVACIFLGLEYLHNNNIIHRDIKPENIVLDDKGYPRITDLGIARYFRAENSADTSGTPGYMAPEVICRQNHTFAVDYFALGVIAYEFMVGRRPYNGRSRNEIRDQILSRQVQIKKNEIPDGWSLEAADFVNRLIQRKATNRLGYLGSHDIRNHPWLRQFPWDKLTNKELTAPYRPPVPDCLTQAEVDNFDEKQISSQNAETKQLLMQNIVMLRKEEVQNLFEGYESSNLDDIQ